MAWTNDDVARLEKAIASGTTLVRFASGAETRYQSIDAMLKALYVMRAEIAAAADSESESPGSVRYFGSKGLS